MAKTERLQVRKSELGFYINYGKAASCARTFAHTAETIIVMLHADGSEP